MSRNPRQFAVDNAVEWALWRQKFHPLSPAEVRAMRAMYNRAAYNVSKRARIQARQWRNRG